MDIIKLLKKNMSESNQRKIRSFFESFKFNNKVKYINLNNVRIISPKKTIDDIISLIRNEKKGAYFRLGDGDVYLMKNIGKDRSQRFNVNLSRELIQAASMSGEGILKSLAINSSKFGLEAHMEFGVHQVSNYQAEKLMLNCIEFFIGEKIYSPVAIHYALVYQSTSFISLFREIKNKSVIFVGGEHNSIEIISRLLGTSKLVRAPNKDAYDEIDRIYTDIIRSIPDDSSYTIIAMACGASSKVLTKRLMSSNYNIFAIDLGSVVDVFHNRLDWTWIKKANLKSEYIWNLLDEIQ